MVIDFFAQKNEFPEFKISKKYKSLISKKDETILVKPETFMNESGSAVKKILSNVNSQMLMVVHDDIDMPLGKIKFSKDSGAGGHKGVDSIIRLLGTKDFTRLKIGIANHETWNMEHGTKKVKAKDIVLKKFTGKEKEVLENIIEKAVEALDFFIEEGLEKTMNAYN